MAPAFSVALPLRLSLTERKKAMKLSRKFVDSLHIIDKMHNYAPNVPLQVIGTHGYYELQGEIDKDVAILLRLYGAEVDAYSHRDVVSTVISFCAESNMNCIGPDGYLVLARHQIDDFPIAFCSDNNYARVLADAYPDKAPNNVNDLYVGDGQNPETICVSVVTIRNGIPVKIEYRNHYDA